MELKQFWFWSHRREIGNQACGHRIQREYCLRPYDHAVQEKKERLIKVNFLNCIWEIRAGNPSLVVKIFNVTHRPILPSQYASMEMASDSHSRFFTRHTQRTLTMFGLCMLGCCCMSWAGKPPTPWGRCCKACSHQECKQHDTFQN